MSLEGGTKMRFIGIRHRIKQTAEGEARPTLLVIVENGETKEMELADDTAELDFVFGRFPVSYRTPGADEDLAAFLPRHIKWRKVRPDQEVPANLMTRIDKVLHYASSVPESYDGLRQGDVVGMVLGGSGDNFAFALSRRAEQIGAKIMRLPPHQLKAHRRLEKADDASNLAQLVAENPELFYLVGPREREIITVRERYIARIDAMKDRIACEQRLRQNLVGKIFRSPDGGYPEGEIEQLFEEEKANDVIFTNLLAEENRREKELTAALNSLAVYQQVFAPILGMGPMIAARIISVIIDIRRFRSKPAFRKFCGVHSDGTSRLPRKRRGEVANWNPNARQGFYLMGDQFNRRKDSFWGNKFLENKAKLRAKHPEPVEENGKKKYTPIHIHKMALWRTRTQLANHIYRTWKQLENGGSKQEENVA
jgi:hypothetical protein